MSWSAEWIDTFSRALGTRQSRRNAIRGVAGVAVGVTLPFEAFADNQPGPPTPGSCQQAGTTPCCVNLLTDAAHCGTCGHACPPGQVCIHGTCSCPSGLTYCGTQCVNTLTDNSNCGACGRLCSPGMACIDGACVLACPAGETVCGPFCINTLTDPDNCGGCGRACPSGMSCSNGACVTSCPTSETTCGNQCVNLQTDNSNCRSCCCRSAN